MKNKILIFFVIIVLIIILFIPLLNSCNLLNTFLSIIISNKEYYSSLSYLISIVVGILGVLLGFFYFENRKNTDLDIKERELKSKRVEILIDTINEYDQLVHHILDRTILNNHELIKVQHNIERIWEIILSYLELGDSLYGMDEITIRKILRVHSYVEKSPIIMHKSLKILKSNSYKTVEHEKKEYKRLIAAARICCLSSICRKK